MPGEVTGMAGKERVYYFVYWDNIDRKSYLYGADLTIRKDKSVHFQNAMMPAGSVIQEWDSIETDTIIRKEPELPLLVEGRHYRIHVYAYADKEKTVIMRLNFFDRQRNLVRYQMVDAEEVEITCPPGAYRYSLQLINAGMGEFDFQCILITTVDDDSVSESDFPKNPDEEPAAGLSEGKGTDGKSPEAEDKGKKKHRKKRTGSRSEDSVEQPNRESGDGYCGKLMNRDEKGTVLTVIVPPYTRRMVRLPNEEELRNINNCVVAPVTILMPEPFYRKDWIGDIPVPAEGGLWKSIHFVSYSRETDSYVKEIAGLYKGGFPILLENERKLGRL